MNWLRFSKFSRRRALHRFQAFALERYRTSWLTALACKPRIDRWDVIEADQQRGLQERGIDGPSQPPSRNEKFGT